MKPPPKRWYCKWRCFWIPVLSRRLTPSGDVNFPPKPKVMSGDVYAWMPELFRGLTLSGDSKVRSGDVYEYQYCPGDKRWYDSPPTKGDEWRLCGLEHCAGVEYGNSSTRTLKLYWNRPSPFLSPPSPHPLAYFLVFTEMYLPGLMVIHLNTG